MSKNTRYFSTIEEAQQYYGGNVVPSTEIALVGDGSYVFVSSDNAASGNQQYFDASMTNDEIVSTMTYTAYNEGFAYGETVTYPVAYAAGEAYGYTQGQAYGEEIGYASGYQGGYSYGYSEGYSYGYTEGEAQGGSSLPNVFDDENSAEAFVNGLIVNQCYNSQEMTGMADFQWQTVTAAFNAPESSDFNQTFDTQWFKSLLQQAIDNVDNYNMNYLSPFQLYIWSDATGEISQVTYGYDYDDTNMECSCEIEISADDRVAMNFIGSQDDGLGDVTMYISWNKFYDAETGDENKWLSFANAGTYKFTFYFYTDPESGDDIANLKIEEVVGE